MDEGEEDEDDWEDGAEDILERGKCGAAYWVHIHFVRIGRGYIASSVTQFSVKLFLAFFLDEEQEGKPIIIMACVTLIHRQCLRCS